MPSEAEGGAAPSAGRLGRRAGAAAHGAGAPSFLYLPALREMGQRFTLEGDEAHYALRVVRLRESERATASDGAGFVAVLRVEHVKPDLTVVVESTSEHPRPVASRVLCGAPEGAGAHVSGRADWVVEKLGELGVTAFQPIDTERARWPVPRNERWERLAIAALRQSRSAWRLELLPAAGLVEAMAAARERTRWLADASGPAPPDLALPPDEPCVAAIGPSAGFTDPERKALRGGGFAPIRLAPHRLRTETAAIAVAALWAARRSPVGVDRSARQA